MLMGDSDPNLAGLMYSLFSVEDDLDVVSATYSGASGSSGFTAGADARRLSLGGVKLNFLFLVASSTMS